MSVDKLRILIKILAESHMAIDLGDIIAIPNPYPCSKARLSAKYHDD